MLRIGCIGCGPWGTSLLKAWQQTPGVEVAGVCRRDPARLEELRDKCPAVPVYGSVEDLLADESIGAVSIATPPATHHDLAMLALRAGKHVFVEKPMCTSLAQAREVARLADQTGLVLMVGHLMEHHGPVKAIKQALGQGLIGAPLHLHMQRLKLGRIRSEENVLWSFAPHDLSVATYLFGKDPAWVRAVGHCYAQPRVEDIVFLDAMLQGGPSLHIHVSWLHPQTVRQAVVVGNEGMIVWDDMATGDKVHLARKTFGTDLSTTDGDVSALPYEEGQPLQAECRHFAQCFVSGTRPVNDGWDGVRVVALLEAASQALLEGRAATTL